ncbi:MAG: hypothetical protein JST13_06715, partial [Bacteroidetes bacterium]|nr:hypothetical protein [Bacteroidota bacterium]
IFRKTDSKGRPSSIPFWKIIVILDAVDDTTLTSWMVDPAKQIDGKITIYKIDQDAKLKEIEFKKGYCVYLKDEFKADISYATCEINITGKDIQINTASFQGNWPG